MKKRLLFTGFCVVLICGICLGMSSCGEKAPYQGLNLDDYLKVPEYKGLEIEPYEIKVTDADVLERVQQGLQQAGKDQKLKKGDELEEGDTAKIDYEGKIDGKAFENGSAKDFDLELGSDTFIDGFEDGLIGKKVGEKVSLNLKFPKDYGKAEYAGKDVVFDVNIKSATRKDVPEYTEEYVKKNTDYKSKAEYEKNLRKQIKSEKEEQAKNEQRTSLWSDLLAETKVSKYPETELKAYKEVYSKQIDSMAEQYGMERSELLKQYYGTDDEKKVDALIEDSAKGLIKQEMLVEYIADKEKLTYTDKDKEALIENIKQQGYDDESVKEYTGRTMDEYAHINLQYKNVIDFLMENAVEKKKK